MVAGIQPNWRHICLALFLLIVLWYVFFSNDSGEKIKLETTTSTSPKVINIQNLTLYNVLKC